MDLIQSRSSSNGTKTNFNNPQFQNFISDVQDKRNKIFLSLLREKDEKKSISEKYCKMKEIIPQNLKKTDQMVIKSIHRYFMKKKPEILQDSAVRQNCRKNSQSSMITIYRQHRAKCIRSSNSSQKWNLFMTPEQKNSVFFGNQRALGEKVRVKYLNQERLQKLNKDMMNKHKHRPFFISMHQKRDLYIS